MRDFALLTILLTMGGLALRTPWIGVLALAFVGYMHPQGYGGEWAAQLPAYQLMFIAVALATLIWVVRTRPALVIPWNWQLILIALLWSWFLVTTMDARVSLIAWPKFYEVLKLLPPLVLILLLIDTQQKLFCLIVAITLALSLVALKGGYWAVMTGFQDRVYGPPGSQFYENNAFSVIVAMVIPLLILWLRETSNRNLRLLIMALVALSYAAALSSWSRGGILTLAAMTSVLLWHSRKKWVAAVFILALVAFIPFVLSDKWFDRMATIFAWQESGSAVSRVQVWKRGIEFVSQEPITGGGFEGWRVITFFKGGNIDWHSAYVEIAAEHGLVGLALWTALLFGTIISLVHLVLWARRRGQGWIADYATMIQASLVAYAVGATTLGITYWELPLHLVVISVVLKRFALSYGYPGIREFRIRVNAIRLPAWRSPA